MQVTSPPTGLVAGAVTTGRVDLSWNSASGASSYTIERREAGSDYAAIGTTSNSWYSDRSVAPDTAYFYRVQANGDGGPSTFTAPDLATTVIFEDASLRPYSTVIRASHMCQLQTAINAVRALAGLPAFPFSPVVAGGVIRAAHLIEMRSAMDAACAAIGHGTGGFTDPSPAGVAEKAVHIQQLRSRVE